MCVNKSLRSVAVLLLLLLVMGSPRAIAQDRSVPRADYFLSFGAFHEGNYGTAIRRFKSAAGSGIRSSEGRWVDSICYHTMIGE